MVSLSTWQAEGPPLLSLFMFGGGALGVPGRDPHLRMALPLATEGHIPFWPVLAWGPLPPIEGFTPPVAATMTVGALAWDILCSLAQLLNVQL